MITLTWLFAFAAIALQAVNIALVIQGILHKEARSQVVLVPCLLWYIGLVLRDDGFVFSSKGIEISFVVCAHLVLTGTMILAHRFCSVR